MILEKLTDTAVNFKKIDTYLNFKKYESNLNFMKFSPLTYHLAIFGTASQEVKICQKYENMTNICTAGAGPKLDPGPNWAWARAQVGPGPGRSYICHRFLNIFCIFM